MTPKPSAVAEPKMVEGSGTGVLLGKTTLSELLLPITLRFPELIVLLPPELLSLPVTIGGLTIISLVCGSILRFSVLTLIIAASEGRKKNKLHKLATKAKHNELFFDSKMLLIFDWLYYNYQNTFKLSNIE